MIPPLNIYGSFSLKSEEKLIDLLKRFEIHKKRLKGKIGDDCAYLVEKEGNTLVLSVDSQVEGIHFKREWIAPQYIGYRAMGAALSDLAAKDARPLIALVDLHLSSEDTEEFIVQVYEGMYSLSKRFNFSIAGGNITKDKTFSLSITLIGESNGNIPRRDRARVGDYVYLSGDVGRNRLFLELIERGALKEIPSVLFNKFATPLPKFSLMKDVNMHYKIHAAIDISDGLGMDAGRVAKESRVDIFIYENQIPLHPILKRFGKNALFALSSGEEYEVLFTSKETIIRRGVSLIGRVVKGSGKVFLINSSGRKIEIKSLGFDHFKEE